MISNFCSSQKIEYRLNVTFTIQSQTTMLFADSALNQIMAFVCGSFCTMLVWIASLTVGLVYGIFYFEDHRQSAWPRFIGGTIGFGVSSLILLFLAGWFAYQHYRSKRLSYEEF